VLYQLSYAGGAVNSRRDVLIAPARRSVFTEVDDCGVQAGSESRAGRWRREERGVEFSRIVAFSDGVFAIAITLLVLNLHVPDTLPPGETLGDSLRDQHGDLIAYAISFAVIGRLWLVHHHFFGEVREFNAALMTLNLVYLGFVVLIPFSSEVLGDHGDTTAGVVVYAVNLALTNIIGAAMFVYAGRAGLGEGGLSRYAERPLKMRSVIGAGAFLASIPVALVNPTAAVVIWVAVFFVPGHDRAA
jgi:uncharacterized membrane protein